VSFVSVVSAPGESRTRTGGGEVSALRAYKAYHPDAAIHIVTYRGQSRWMTGKQFDIWNCIQAGFRRHKRITLDYIAKLVHCHRSTVSRTLHRFDLWRFIDLAVVRGRSGGVYVYTRRQPAMDEQMQLSGAKITRATRRIAQTMLAKMIVERERYMAAIEALRARWLMMVNTGNTVATFPIQPTLFEGIALD